VLRCPAVFVLLRSRIGARRWPPGAEPAAESAPEALPRGLLPVDHAQIESTSASLSSTGRLRIASSGRAAMPFIVSCALPSAIAPPRFSASSGASGASRPAARSGAGPVGLGYVWLRVATFSGTDAVSLHEWQGPSDAKTDCRRSHERNQLRQADLHARCTPVHDPAGPVRTAETLLTWVFASN
jgi:hypothetical protein